MKHILLLVALGCCFSCTSNKIPSDILGIDKMKTIIWDMTRAGMLSREQYKKQLIKKDSASYFIKTKENYQQVFNIYGITKDEFYKSYKYYLDHPDKNKILMDSVSAYSNRQREDLYRRLK